MNQIPDPSAREKLANEEFCALLMMPCPKTDIDYHRAIILAGICGRVLEDAQSVHTVDVTKGRAQGLQYALDIIQNRRVINRNSSYLAALDDLKIFIEAALERTQAGEPMGSEAICS